MKMILNKRIYIINIIILMLIFSLSGCKTNRSVKNEVGSLKVYTSFYPIYFATEQIGVERIELYSIIPNGSEPHDYEPSMREIANVENGDIFIYNGAKMEPWSEKLSSSLIKKGIKTLNLSEFVELIDDTGKDHKEHDEHEHEGNYDPHIWLDPINMDNMAYQIMVELSKLDTTNEDFYKKNYEDFSRKLKELDLTYTSELKDRSRDTILVSHQAFSYLTKRYDLKQIAVTGITPHDEPSPRTLANLLDTIEDGSFEFIFLETLASPKVVELLAKEGNLKILELNPIAGLTKEQQDRGEDYFSLMEQNLENLKKALVN